MKREICDVISIALIVVCGAVSAVEPELKSEVSLLGDVRLNYLTQGVAKRHLQMKDPTARRRLVQEGDAPIPVRFAWEGPTNVPYSVSVAPAVGGGLRTLTVTNATEVWLSNLQPGRWYQAKVQGAGISTSTVFHVKNELPRLLRIDGVKNVRDLGGWYTTDGRRVKPGMILRSAGLRASAQKSGGGSILGGNTSPGARRITDLGMATLREDFGIRTDLELRTQQETAFMDGSVLGADVRWVHVPFAAYGFIENETRGRKPFARLFREFCKAENYPILFHCSGGRDRTGTLAFLLNGLLGVPEEDLLRDWETTCFSLYDVSFGPERIEGLLAYLNSFGTGTLTERIERFALSCGVERAEIEAFREIMLERQGLVVRSNPVLVEAARPRVLVARALDKADEAGLVAHEPDKVVITSPLTTFDRTTGVACFDGGVHVRYGADYEMHSDQMFVYCTGDNKLESIVAVGHVAFTNDVRNGSCNRAIFHKAENEIEMLGEGKELPRLSENGNTLSGRRIRIWLDTEQASVDDGRIEINREEGDPTRTLPIGKVAASERQPTIKETARRASYN